jgi:tellurite resistance protein
MQQIRSDAEVEYNTLQNIISIKHQQQQKNFDICLKDLDDKKREFEEMIETLRANQNRYRKRIIQGKEKLPGDL